MVGVPWDTKPAPLLSVAKDKCRTWYPTRQSLSEALGIMQTHLTALLLQSHKDSSRKGHVSGPVSGCRSSRSSKSAAKEMPLAEGSAGFDSNTGCSLTLYAPGRLSYTRSCPSCTHRHRRDTANIDGSMHRDISLESQSLLPSRCLGLWHPSPAHSRQSHRTMP